MGNFVALKQEVITLTLDLLKVNEVRPYLYYKIAKKYNRSGKMMVKCTKKNLSSILHIQSFQDFKVEVLRYKTSFETPT